MAYEIVNRLQVMFDLEILDQLSAAVELTDRLRGKKHEVWEDSFVPIDREERLS